jgi:hypothetical protein
MPPPSKAFDVPRPTSRISAMTPAFNIAKAKAEIDARNRLRLDCGLPASSTAVELRRMFNAHKEREWQDYLAANNSLLRLANIRTAILRGAF